MSDGPLVDETLRRRLTEVAARHADGVPVEGAARARRTARRRAAARTGLVAAAVAAVLVGAPVVIFGSLSTDRGMVAPAVTPAPDPTATSTSTEPTAAESSPTTTTTTITTSATSSVTGTTTDGDLPGVPAEVSVPEPGAVLLVVGVEYDDVLNVRSLPGTDGDIVGGVEPTGEVIATGVARDLDSGRWVEATVDGTTGWVSGRFLALGTGPVEDLTAVTIERHAGVPTATSMPDLAQIVVDALAGDDVDGAAPRVTVAVEPTSGDLEEVTVDWLGLEDDSVLGYRLHVFAIEDSGVYSLRTVEATTLCSRGVTPGGLCV